MPSTIESASIVEQGGPKRRLVWISDSPRIPHIGQAIVSRNMLDSLSKNWDVFVLGFGDANLKTPVGVPYPIQHIHRNDLHDAKKVIGHLLAAKAEIVVFSHDIWLWPTIAEVKAALPNVKFVGWVTIDGIPLFPGWRGLFYAYDLLISPTKWGQNEILNRWLDLDVSHIPYAIDHTIFHTPKQGKAEFKRLVQAASQTDSSSRRMDVEGKFVGMYVGANQNRKNLGAIYAGWKQFAKDRDDVEFFLLTHSAMLDMPHVGDYALSEFMDAEHLTIIPTEVPLDWLAKFMCISDVLLHPSSGEGFGLTTLEAMACGTVPLVCGYSGQTDFCTPETSYYLPWEPHIGPYNVVRAMAVHRGVAETLGTAHMEWHLGTIEAKRQRGIAMAAKYNWAMSAAMMNEKLTDLLLNKEERLVVRHIL